MIPLPFQDNDGFLKPLVSNVWIGEFAAEYIQYIYEVLIYINYGFIYCTYIVRWKADYISIAL
jgi:hypothetical protein